MSFRWISAAFALACSALIGACAGDAPAQRDGATAIELHDELDHRARHQSEYARI